MITLLPAAERFHTENDWVDSWHSFSFGQHHDDSREGFRNLVVINDDRVRADEGVGNHGHEEMEIVTYLVSGMIEHKDSIGTHDVIEPGDVQRMTAGKGVRHSEMNPLPDEEAHLLQIWLLPNRGGLAPGYAQQRFEEDSKHNTLKLVVSGTPREGVVDIHSDVDLYAAVLDEGAVVSTPLARSGHGWVQVIRGAVDVNGVAAAAGDGLQISDVAALTITGKAADSELLVFDLA